MVSFWALVGLQTTLSSEVLFCSYNPPTSPGIGTSEERRGTEVTSTRLSGPCSKQGEGDGGSKWPGRPEGALGRPPSQPKLHAVVRDAIFKENNIHRKRTGSVAYQLNLYMDECCDLQFLIP